MSILTYNKNNFYLDGAPFRIIAGDIHYFRIHPSKWEHTLELAVDFGLNTIQTYVPWNAHEPNRDEFVFSDMLDLAGFLALCDKKGLKVLLRPSPYICSEWDLGGLPAWLLKDKELVLRSSDPKYISEIKRYYDHLIPVFLPYLSTQNGPIIAVCIENEYGSYGNDHNYLNAISGMLKQGGVDVPLYTTDNASAKKLTFGRADKSLFFGVNYRAKPEVSYPVKETLLQLEDAYPFFVGEFWSGRAMHFGEPFYHRPPEEVSCAFKEVLELGGNVCFYMFAGGTNFGFMGGANYGKSYSPKPNTPIRYIPHTTSYDVDALIGENSLPTEKYFLCRDVLDEHLGKKTRPHRYETPATQSLTTELYETAELFENLDALTQVKAVSIKPKPMEDYGQNYGLILYTTVLNAFEENVEINIHKFRDRANIYVDNHYFATFLRDRGLTKTADQVNVSGVSPLLVCNGAERKINVLVENLGRINFGKEITDERKGLEDHVTSSSAKLFNYETRTLPLNDLSRLSWSKNPHKNHMPCFFRGQFYAKRGIDTFVDISAFGHGYVWINGFNIGRYDSAGPQMTLYVPGALLKEKNNEIIVLDIDPVGKRNCISLSDHEILEGDAADLS